MEAYRRGGRWRRMALLCSSGTGNLPADVASHESRPRHLLAGASVMEARQLGRGGRGEQAGRGEEA
jgi:hypothetical protein